MYNREATLSGLLASVEPDVSARWQVELATHHPQKLLKAYTKAFATDKPAAAFLLADSLTARGIPPCFRLTDSYRTADLTGEQRFDLVVHDLQWLAALYPEHWRRALGSYAYLLRGGDWLARAEYYQSTLHRGETWLMVRQLALSVDQQWECNALRSMPVKRAAQGLAYRRTKVREAIMARLPEAMQRRRREDALATLQRRYEVWVCGEMTGQSPTRASRLYGLWTGKEIPRAVADRDIRWVRRHVPASRKRRV